MYDFTSKNNLKLIINERRTVFQYNNIKMNKIKKEIKDLNFLNNQNEKQYSVKNTNYEFNKQKNNDQNSFTPLKVTSKKFQHELYEEINFVNSNSNNHLDNQIKNPFYGARLPKLNPLKIVKHQKQVIKIDDILILHSEFSSSIMKQYQKTNFLNENKKLIEELENIKYLNEFYKFEDKKNKIKLKDKKTYKSYDKVLGNKFTMNFYSKIKTKQKIVSNNNKKNKSSNSLDNSLTLDKSDKKINKKNTYLTAFEEKETNISNNIYNNSEENINSNIFSKLEKLKNKNKREINYNITENKSNSIEYKKKFKNNNSRCSSNGSRAKSNYSDRNQNEILESLNDLKIIKNSKLLDNFIRLPKILASKIDASYTQLNSLSNNSFSRDVISKPRNKNFDNTKRQRLKFDNLVSKISTKLANGNLFKKYVKDYSSIPKLYSQKILY